MPSSHHLFLLQLHTICEIINSRVSAKSMFCEVAVTFDHQNLLSSSLSPSWYLPRYNEIPPRCSWDIPFTRIGQGGYMYRQEAWKQYAPGYGLQWHINWLLLNPVSAALTINMREGILMRLDHVVKYDFTLSLFQEDGVNLQEKQDWTVCLIPWQVHSTPRQISQLSLSLVLYHSEPKKDSAIKARTQTLLRHFSKAESNFSIVLRPTSPDIHTDIRPDSLTLQRVTATEGVEFSNPTVTSGAVFLGKTNTAFLINTSPRVCMMTEIRRGEEHQVALWGWTEFMAPSPQRNYLTSLLIKSANTAAHYNGRLTNSVYLEPSSVQWRWCLCLHPFKLTHTRSGVTVGLPTVQQTWQQ